MRNPFILFALIVVLYSCDKKDKIETAVEEIPIEMKINRFDKAFYESKPQDLGELKSEYPFFFPPGNDDKVWTDKMQDPLWREVYTEVEKKFGNMQTQQTELEALFKHIKYYFPNTKIPATYSIIGQMDYNMKTLYAKDTLIVSLELYLGRNHKFYVSSFPEYLRYNFDEKQMMPDVVSAFAPTKIPPPTENTFLSQMIYFGKELYLKDILLPEYNDADRMGYQPEQIAWCEENESYIWRYFIENNALYDTDQKLVTRFISPAPFSKFYLEIDNESPGRVGAWIGWQIVRSYMQNNEVSLQKMLKTGAKEIFDKSKYKPKK